MPRDLYEILGVAKTASAEEINKVYKKLARQYHPDRNPGDKQAEATFKEIQNAYETLNDPDKRAKYDRFGHAGAEAGGMPGGFNFGGPGGASFEGDPEMAQELFKRFFAGGGGGGAGDMFGGGSPRGKTGRGRRAPAEAIPVNATIPFMTAARGGKINLRVGSNEIEVKIPVGFEDGKKLRVAGQGPNGEDITVTVRVEPHAYFRREGKDVLLEVPISVSEAILGGKVEIPTIDDKRVEVKIRPGTSSGSRTRLPGFGINGGDQYLLFKVMVPKGTPDEKTIQLLEEYSKLQPFDARAEVAWK